MTLTAEQISDMRADLGDQVIPYAFEDLELDRLYTRNESDWNTTLIMAIDQLLMGTAKFYNYAAGYTRQDEGQVFDHLLKMRDVFASRSNGAFIVPIHPVRRRKHHAKHKHLDDGQGWCW